MPRALGRIALRLPGARVFAALAALALVAAFALPPSPCAAEKKTRPVDLFWARPDLDSLGVTSIAFLPAATYDNNLEVEKQVQGALGQALHQSGHRWVSAQSARDILQRDSSGISLMKSVRQALLKNPRVDSLTAPLLCGRLRTRAVMSVRVDNWQQVKVEWNQTGKPSTMIQLKAALVDTLGRLLWTASGSETVEGPYYDPSAQSSELTTGAIGHSQTSGPAPPSYPEVLARILTRWAANFPARPGAVPAKP